MLQLWELHVAQPSGVVVWCQPEWRAVNEVDGGRTAVSRTDGATTGRHACTINAHHNEDNHRARKQPGKGAVTKRTNNLAKHARNDV